MVEILQFWKHSNDWDDQKLPVTSLHSSHSFLNITSQDHLDLYCRMDWLGSAQLWTGGSKDISCHMLVSVPMVRSGTSQPVVRCCGCLDADTHTTPPATHSYNLWHAAADTESWDRKLDKMVTSGLWSHSLLRCLVCINNSCKNYSQWSTVLKNLHTCITTAATAADTPDLTWLIRSRYNKHYTSGSDSLTTIIDDRTY